MGVEILIFIFITPKGTSLHGTASFDVASKLILLASKTIIFMLRDGQYGGLYCRLAEEPKNEHFRSYISPIWGEETPGPIWTKLGTGEIPGT